MLPKSKFSLIVLVFLVNATTSSESEESLHLHLIILSSPSAPHHTQRRSELFRHFIGNQFQEYGASTHTTFYFTHTGDRSESAFILVPAIVDFLQARAHTLTNQSWILLCEPETRINVTLTRQIILHQLAHVNTKRDLWWGGRRLVDEDITIRHHFSPPRDLAYPFVASGVLITLALARSIAAASLSNEMSFRIDPAYEFSKLLREQFNNTRLHHLEDFCLTEAQREANLHRCATWPTPYYWRQHCEPVVPKAEVLVAVKTCQQYFKDRIPLIKATWASDVDNVIYFAEVFDSSIPTVALDVPNTEHGHCGKLLAILKYVRGHEKWPSLRYVVIVDDDTLINEYRLRSTLGCYLQDMDMLALGERYGYMGWQGTGYLYITGGGGIVLSVNVIERLLQSTSTACPTIDAPDDMLLGMWLRHVSVPITHSHLFHQARAYDYAPALVSTDYVKAISYHKYWMIDDVSKYFSTWLQDVTRGHNKTVDKSILIKDEL